MQGAKPVRLAAGAFLLCVRVVAGFAPCRVTPLTLGVTLQRSATPPFPSGPCVPPGAPYQNALGAVPQDPLTLKLRLDTDWTFQLPLKSRSVRRRRYALKVPAAAFYARFSRNQIKNQPYKRRLIPLREAVALAFRAGQKGSPQGRKTLWGEEDAPQRGGLPKVKHRVSPTQAEVASDERTGL